MNEDQVSLNEEEANQLGEIDRLLFDLKLRLGDLEIQKNQLSNETQHLIAEFHKHRGEFLEKLNYIATLHGLDINGPVKYVLDINQMCFKKL